MRPIHPSFRECLFLLGLVASTMIPQPSRASDRGTFEQRCSAAVEAKLNELDERYNQLLLELYSSNPNDPRDRDPAVKFQLLSAIQEKTTLQQADWDSQEDPQTREQFCQSLGITPDSENGS